MQIKGSLSDKLNIDTGVPQGSILGPLLFTIYINNLVDNLSDADIHLYADDTIIYCSAPSMERCISKLQVAFERVQRSLLSLKLVLNDKKTKYMTFARSRRNIPIPPLLTLQGSSIDLVSSYKYLGFVLEEDLSFKLHVKQLVSKLKLKLGFYYRNSACFSQSARRKLVEATYLPVLDYGDIFYRNTTKALLQSLDSTYHSALRFITRRKHSTHHCVLYDLVGWPSLDIRRHKHWLLFVYKAIVGQLPLYIQSLLSFSNQGYNLRSSSYIVLNVPMVKTEFGKTAFSHCAPTHWNELQKSLKLAVFMSVAEFKAYLNDTFKSVCACF